MGGSLAKIIACITLILFATVAFAQNDGEEAVKAALEKINSLPGFVAVYRGKSSVSEIKPEIYIGFSKPDKLFVRVPAMNFFASHKDGQIRIQSGDSGIIMPFNEVKQLRLEAEKGFLGLDWLNMANPDKLEINPMLSLELEKGALNIGISFGSETEPFSWLNILKAGHDAIVDTKEHWVVSQKTSTGGEYKYWISRKTGVLTKMTDEKDGKVLRSLELVEFKKTPPEDSSFTEIFTDGITVDRFGSSPSQKAQLLIGLYDGIYQALLAGLLPKWNDLDEKERKAVAGAVSIYWKTVYKNVFGYQKENLLKTLKDPGLAEKIAKLASDKTAYEKFVNDLPDDKTIKAKELWQERILGLVGYEILDPFVGWATDRYIVHAKDTIEKLGPKYGISKEQGNILLGIISMPIIDACYVSAEPIVLPTLMPLIKKAAKDLEG